MINKVLAIILYISGLFDSKPIVKEVVWRKNTNKGGGHLLIQGGDYIYIYIMCLFLSICISLCIYIYIYIHTHIAIAEWEAASICAALSLAPTRCIPIPGAHGYTRLLRRTVRTMTAPNTTYRRTYVICVLCLYVLVCLCRLALRVCGVVDWCDN